MIKREPEHNLKSAPFGLDILCKITFLKTGTKLSSLQFTKHNM